MQRVQHWANLFICLYFLRAFGDKSSPPSLSDTESEDLENSEECETSEQEAETEVEKCEERQSSGETVSDPACCGLEKLILTQTEEDKGEPSSELEEEHQEEKKTPQGTC